MSLFRAYNIPYTAYADTEGYYAVDYEELLATIRDEAVAYLEKETEAMKKMGVDKGSYIAKEGFAADEIISLGRKTPASTQRSLDFVLYLRSPFDMPLIAMLT